MDQGTGRILGEDGEGAGKDGGEGERRCVSLYDWAWECRECCGRERCRQGCARRKEDVGRGCWGAALCVRGCTVGFVLRHEFDESPVFDRIVFFSSVMYVCTSGKGLYEIFLRVEGCVF